MQLTNLGQLIEQGLDYHAKRVIYFNISAMASSIKQSCRESKYHLYKNDEITGREFEEKCSNLQKRYEEMVSCLDGTY
jgi:hypothetical protein